MEAACVSNSRNINQVSIDSEVVNMKKDKVAHTTKLNRTHNPEE